MPRVSKGQKRPADVVGNAVRVMEIATGQAEEQYDASDAGKTRPLPSWGGRAGASEFVADTQRFLPSH